MVFHVCPRCHYQTKYKTSLREHYNRKNKCESLFNDITIDDCISLLNIKKINVCEHCDKKFTRSDSLKRHKERCYELRLKILEEKNKILEEKLDKSSLNTVNNVNINCGNTYNININDFNNTNYIIALEDLKQSIRQSLLKNDGRNMNIECENLVELVHCNDKYPENQNILITDRTRGEAKIKQGDKFVSTRIDDAIEETAKNIVKLLKANQIFNRYVKFHENKDEDTIREDKKAIERTLYNNRDKVMNTARENNVKV